MASVEQIARLLARAKADRGSVILAVGGGVVGDVVGFAPRVIYAAWRWCRFRRHSLRKRQLGRRKKPA